MGKKKGGAKKKDRRDGKILDKVSFLLGKQHQRDTEAKTAPSAETLCEDVAQLNQLMDQVIELQSVLPPPTDGKQDRFKSLVQWLKQTAPQCFYGERFTFDVEVSEGTGVVAARDLKDGEHFMSIPRKAMMTEEDMWASPVGAILAKDPMCKGMPSVALACFIVYEKLSGKSFWKPYLDTLPLTFPLPLLAPPEDVALLQGSPCHLDVLRLQKGTIRQYVHLQAHTRKRGLPPLCYADFRWAVAVLMSRQNRVPSKTDPSKSIIALIPAWDNCNHRAGKIATYFNPEQDTSESFAMEDVTKGSPIFLYYGDRPNSKLFVYQGFVFTDNKNDFLELRLKLDTNEPLYKIRTLILMKGGFGLAKGVFGMARGVDMDHFANGPLQFARAATMDKAEATGILKKGVEGLNERISDANETKAWAFLLSQAEAALAAYRLDADTCLKKIEAGGLSGAQEGAMRLLHGEQLILNDVVSYCKVQVLPIEALAM